MFIVLFVLIILFIVAPIVCGFFPRGTELPIRLGMLYIVYVTHLAYIGTQIKIFFTKE